MQLLTKGVRHLPRWFTYGATIGILAKIKDEPGGSISTDGSFSKPLTGRDREKLERGTELARQILIEAGARPASILATAVRGAHPGGTAAIGRVVDGNLETRVKRLYVCDASVLPRSMAAPQVLTLVSLARRLARHLLEVN
jgi:choline dehydrogenase-like flavoprotein